MEMLATIQFRFFPQDVYIEIKLVHRSIIQVYLLGPIL
jgi:hypothetical protein